jgi:hypothetical protein
MSSVRSFCGENFPVEFINDIAVVCVFEADFVCASLSENDPRPADAGPVEAGWIPFLA